MNPTAGGDAGASSIRIQLPAIRTDPDKKRQGTERPDPAREHIGTCAARPTGPRQRTRAGKRGAGGMLRDAARGRWREHKMGPVAEERAT